MELTAVLNALVSNPLDELYYMFADSELDIWPALGKTLDWQVTDSALWGSKPWQ